MEVDGKRSCLLTADEVCRLTRYSKQTIYKMVHAGEIPFKQLKPGGRFLFDPAEINEWIDTKLTPA